MIYEDIQGLDKKETRERRINFAIILAGLALVICMIIYSRWGVSWFTDTSWSQVSIIKWIFILIILSIALVLQYYFLMLLRYSFARYLVLWLPPIIWLFNNGLVAIQRLLESAAEETLLTGWFPITDLLGWLLALVFFPLLAGGGAVVGIIDSSSLMLTQACSIAGIALDVTGTSTWDFLSHILKFFNIFRELVADSFMQAIVTEGFKTRSFFDIRLDGIFRHFTATGSPKPRCTPR